jgi:DNA polymerase III sliding clamp (beta) subunit (PCNA family)
MARLPDKFMIPTKLVKLLCEAASTDATRPHINGLCVDVADGVVFTTDGHRMAVREIPESAEPPPYRQVINRDFRLRLEIQLNKKSGLYKILKDRFKDELITISTVCEGLQTKLKIESQKDSVSALVDVIEASSPCDASTEIKMGINSAYLIAALNRFVSEYPKYITDDESTVFLDFTGSGLDPLTVRSKLGKNDDLEIIMPTRA